MVNSCCEIPTLQKNTSREIHPSVYSSPLQESDKLIVSLHDIGISITILLNIII